MAEDLFEQTWVRATEKIRHDDASRPSGSWTLDPWAAISAPRNHLRRGIGTRGEASARVRSRDPAGKGPRRDRGPAGGAGRRREAAGAAGKRPSTGSRHTIVRR